MPLRCGSITGEPVHAYEYDREQWKELAAQNRQDKHLVMACCGRPVVVKTSHCGTQFFAHVRRDDTNCPHETEEHLLAKDLVARAIIEAGWQAETEAVLTAHNLIADVLATKGKKRVAFEVQWSRQTMETTYERHAAYAKAGIRELWLFKQALYPLSKDLPAFRMTPTEHHTFDVDVWRDGNGYQKATKIFQTADLSAFVKGALLGQLKWNAAVGLTVPAIAHVSHVFCSCDHELALIMELELDIARRLPGHLNPRFPVSRFAEHPEFLRTETARQLLDAAGVCLRFGVQKGHGRTETYYRYLDTHCAACQRLADWEVVKDYHTPSKPAFEVPITLTPQLLASIPALGRQLECWHFNQE